MSLSCRETTLPLANFARSPQYLILDDGKSFYLPEYGPEEALEALEQGSQSLDDIYD